MKKIITTVAIFILGGASALLAWLVLYPIVGSLTPIIISVGVAAAALYCKAARTETNYDMTTYDIPSNTEAIMAKYYISRK